MAVELNRREVLLAAGAVCAGWLTGAGCAARLTDLDPPTRLLPKNVAVVGNSAQSVAGRADPIADPLPFGWQTSQIPTSDAGGLRIYFTGDRPIGGRTWLRLTFATRPIEPGTGTVQVLLAQSRRSLGQIELNHPRPCEIAELEISPTDAEAARIEGLWLSGVPTLKGLWIFNTDNPDTRINRSSRSGQTAPPAFLPQLLVGAAGDRMAQLRDRLASLESIQPFGFFEGCVLDGQLDLALATGEERYTVAADLHLSQFQTPSEQASAKFENYEPTLSRFGWVANTLPIAAIARRDPGHALIDQAIDFWKRTQDKEGCVKTGESADIESAYGVAYPMAVVARIRRAPQLATVAARQLTILSRRNVRGQDLYQSIGPEGVLRGKNEARTVAWWMLGLSRTLKELNPSERPAELSAELARVAAWAQGRQLTNGLWPEVLEEPSKGTDPIGSAGIAAAMAIATNAGLLPRSFAANARKTLSGISSFLTPDGYLAPALSTGTAGESAGELNRRRTRIISPFAVGLVAQLMASLQPRAGI